MKTGLGMNPPEPKPQLVGKDSVMASHPNV
jgi:hypothetical protein